MSPIIDDSNATVDPTTEAASPADLPRRPCAWCAGEFAVERRAGRPRIYCNHTCRQRAYEHRHGFCHERSVRPLPGQADGDRWMGSGYERGGHGLGRNRVHAMRTSVRPEGRARETLCGALVAPTLGMWFVGSHPKACAICRNVVRRNPLRHGISASNELSRLRALIDEAAEERIEPNAALHWILHDAA